MRQVTCSCKINKIVEIKTYKINNQTQLNMTENYLKRAQKGK